MIVGTAGHIDHGKTTLVRALTGVDTDRLKEEKARGISIELGYAYVDDPAGTTLGFIDVPGHERLVHTMLAGACGIDFGLVVVAADDGVMPQTREHVAILDLLGVRAGVVALSKADRVSASRLDAVRDEVRALLGPTALAAAPMYPVNATNANDAGVTELARAIREAAREIPARGAQGLFRLAVDRAFALAGHGTVVTGTVFAGRVEVGATLHLLPSGVETRIRSIHAQNRAAAEGRAGERCALNLVGVETRSVSRGDWLADPRGLAVTDRVDARLRLLSNESATLGGYTPVHVHFGSTHAMAHVLLLEGERLRPGETARVQLVFDRPVCAATGDRFVLRNAQATGTLGGGTFLDVRAPARRRRSDARRRHLDAVEQMLATGDITALLEAAPWGLSGTELMLVTGMPTEALSVPAGVRRVAEGRAADEEYWICESHWNSARERIVAALAAFHEGHPDDPGPDTARLRRIAAPTAPESPWHEAVESLVREGGIRRQGAWLQLPAHAAGLSEREREAMERLLPLMIAGRFDPPWVRDLAARTGEPETRVRQLLAALGREGRAHAVVRDLYYPRETLAELAAVFDRLAAEYGAVPAAEFRDAIGLGRKRSIQILEFFDRVGYTRRIGEAHVPRGGGGWREVR